MNEDILYEGLAWVRFWNDNLIQLIQFYQSDAVNEADNIYVSGVKFFIRKENTRPVGSGAYVYTTVNHLLRNRKSNEPDYLTIKLTKNVEKNESPKNIYNSITINGRAMRSLTIHNVTIWQKAEKVDGYEVVMSDGSTTIIAKSKLGMLSTPLYDRISAHSIFDPDWAYEPMLTTGRNLYLQVNNSKLYKLNGEPYEAGSVTMISDEDTLEKMSREISDSNGVVNIYYEK